MVNYPPLNIELFRYLYPDICVSETSPSDNMLLICYQRQVSILGYLYDIDTLSYQTLGEVMEYALAHFFIMKKRGGRNSSSVTGEIQFTQTVEQKTATKASEDTGYLTSADYGVKYWNQSQYGIDVMTICMQYMRKVLCSIGTVITRRRETPEDYMYTSKTLDIDNVSIQKTIDLRVNRDKSDTSDNKVLSIKDKVLNADAYTTGEIDEMTDAIQEDLTKIEQEVAVATEKADKAETDAQEAKEKAIAAEEKAQTSIDLHNDMKVIIISDNDSVTGSFEFDPETNILTLDLISSGGGEQSYPPVANGIEYANINGKTTLSGKPVLDIANSAKTQSEENTRSIVTLNQEMSDETQARESSDQQLQNEIDQTDENLAAETIRATQSENTLNTAITTESNRAKVIEAILQNELNVNNSQLIAICSGYNALSSGIPVLADIQAAIAASSSGKIAISFNFASGEVTGLMIEAAGVPDLYKFAINMTKYMQSSTEVRRAYPDFQMVYNGNNFLVTNGSDNILLSIDAVGNDLFKLSHNGNANILNINNSSQPGYYAKFELSELSGFDGIDNKAAITWSEYAIASPVCALKVPFGNIGDLMGFDTQFDNKNPDGAGQREYKVTLKFLVVTDSGVAGKSTFTIYNGLDANDGAFHMWTAGIVPEIDYSNQNTDHDDVYTFEVDNLRITPITINLKKSVFIENRLRKFYFGISMKGWFQNPHTVNYKLYDYVEMILTPV